MANKFVGDPSITGKVAFVVKDTEGNIKKTYENANSPIRVRELACQMMLGSASLGNFTHTSQYSDYALIYCDTNFKTNQTQTHTDGGPAGLPGVGVFPNMNGTGGTYLALAVLQTGQNSTNSSFSPNVIASGSFLNAGNVSQFQVGGQWHNSNYNPGGNSLSRGFANEYFRHFLGGGSFAVSSGDTITVSWDFTLS